MTDAFVARNLPWTIAKLKVTPAFEFENWAVIALGGIPNKVQVGDMGVDGRIFPVGTKPTDIGSMFSDDWFPIQVKQMDKVSPSTSSGQTAPTSTPSKPSWNAKAKAAASAASSSPSATPRTPSRNAPRSTSERVESSSC